MELGSGTLRRCNIPSRHGGVLASPNIERPEGFPCLELLQDGDTITVTILRGSNRLAAVSNVMYSEISPFWVRGRACHVALPAATAADCATSMSGRNWGSCGHQHCHSHPVGGWRERAAHSHLRVAAGHVYVRPGTAPIIPSIGCSPWRESGQGGWVR